MSPTRRESITSVAAQVSAVEEPAILHTARFEMSVFMEDGRPITLSIETEFGEDGGIWTTAESSRIGKLVSCDRDLDALAYLRKLQSLAEQVATAHRFYEDGPSRWVPQKLRQEPPIGEEVRAVSASWRRKTYRRLQ